MLPEPILYVEDDALLARAVRRVLGGSGFDVIHAVSCAAARNLVDGYRLGIFDLDLPDGDGATLAHELLETGVVYRAVFFTGGGDPAALAQAAQLGTVVHKGDGDQALLDALGRARAVSDLPPEHRPAPKSAPTQKGPDSVEAPSRSSSSKPGSQRG